ncbi:glucuronyl esterase domain-containing protein [Sorangium sp. So ce363]|uniref:glucuronyl esterase domain-containing protein n=1 Tax=Sorangium sp. So ce363 TaxID=3133304 RepID=UPI003F6485B1
MRTLATRAARAALGLCLTAAACGQSEPNLSGQGGAGGGSDGSGGESATSSGDTTSSASSGVNTTSSASSSGGTTSSSSSGVDTTSSSSSGTGPDDTPVENESADCEVAALPEASALPKISKLPDPFKRLDGTSVSTRAEWHCRRQEIRKQAEKYIYGEKPTPDVVTGTVTENKISVHVEAQGKKIDFSADIVLPSKGEAPFPAIINVGGKGGFGGITLGESRVLDQGVAVIYYNHNEIGREGTAEQSRGKPNPGKFYDIYGGNHSAGLLMAWAWGASRILDVIQASGGDIIDPTGIGVTGCSRNGKGAFAIGVFDDRIALTIPHETSTAGVPAYRIADVLGKERTDHNYFGLNWLSNNFEPFVFKNNASNAVKLPIDTHALIAMMAPRGLLVLENPHQAQMGAPAGHTATAAGAEVYKALGVEKNVSYHSKVAETAHCSYKNEYTDLLAKNIARFLKHEGEAPGEFVVGSGGSLSMADWVDWQAPALE